MDTTNGKLILVATIRKIPQKNVSTAERTRESIKATGIQSEMEAKMEHLKKPIEINQETADALAAMKGTLGFNKKLAWFIVFQDYRIEERYTYKKRWGFFSRRETKIVSYYITDYKFHLWSTKRQAWTRLTEEGLNVLLEDPDFNNMRKNYFTMIKAPLEFLGVKFRTNKITSNEHPTK